MKKRENETEKHDTCTFRLEHELVVEIDAIAELETKRTGYKLKRSNIVQRALQEFIERYKSSNIY